MIGASDDGHFAVHPDFDFCHVRNLHVKGGICVVRNVSGFAEGSAILDRDDKIVGQQRLMVATSPCS
jgi:hypothetical protein